MMKELIFIAEEGLEGGFMARALGVRIFIEADTMEQLKENIKKAVVSHFKPNELPIIRLRYVKEEVLVLE